MKFDVVDLKIPQDIFAGKKKTLKSCLGQKTFITDFHPILKMKVAGAKCARDLGTSPELPFMS